MDHTEQRLADSQPKPQGVTHDIRKLKEHGTASLAELQQFMGSMKGRSPSEVLGVIAQSSLVKSTILATMGTLVLLFALTAIPWMMSQKEGEQSQVVRLKNEQKELQQRLDQINKFLAKKEGKAAAVASANANAESSGESQMNSDANSSTNSDATNAKKAASALGVDQVKTSSPDKNPLEKDLDNLLDGLK